MIKIHFYILEFSTFLRGKMGAEHYGVTGSIQVATRFPSRNPRDARVGPACGLQGREHLLKPDDRQLVLEDLEILTIEKNLASRKRTFTPKILHV